MCREGGSKLGPEQCDARNSPWGSQNDGEEKHEEG